MTQTNSYNSKKLRRPFNIDDIQLGSKVFGTRELDKDELDAVLEVPSIASDLELIGLAERLKQ